MGRAVVCVCLALVSHPVHAQVKDQPKQVDGETKPPAIVKNKGVPPHQPAVHAPAGDAGKITHAAKSTGDAARKVPKHSILGKLPSRSPLALIGIATDLVELTGVTRAKKKEPEEATTGRTVKKAPAEPDHDPGPKPKSKPKHEPNHERGEIFDSIQLTTTEAKGLEDADPFADIELTGPKGKAGG